MPTYDVTIPYTEITARRARWAAAQRLERVEPVPVFTPFHSRFFVGQLDLPPERYFRDARAMLGCQLWWRAWVLNNVRSDFHDLAFWADQGDYGESWALGCELAFDEHSPWIKTHPVRDEADLVALERRDPLDNPAIAHEARMREQMAELAEDYVLRFADGVQIRPAEGIRPRNSTVGLFTLARDLRGPEIYVDIKQRPHLVHRLMAIVTEKTIQRLEWIRREFNYPMQDVFINDDSAASLSPRDYREFVLPYNLHFKNHFGGTCTLHCCGPATHLVSIWADELGVDIMWNFSFETDRHRVAGYMGGKAVLMGNVNWKLIALGTPDEVYRDALDVLQTFASYGGHILSTPNIAPGAPLQNINAMYRAAQDFAPNRTG